uniref:Uncharacterized protein n=1 Tax=Nelumbo nucifera TaxID=4432 RepID=A0A822ZEJ4_NELNU|nr:TPA_asm: hypothetical protein HUJ06_001782 [Nelumbo nucifera]
MFTFSFHVCMHNRDIYTPTGSMTCGPSSYRMQLSRMRNARRMLVG